MAVQFVYLWVQKAVRQWLQLKGGRDNVPHPRMAQKEEAEETQRPSIP